MEKTITITLSEDIETALDEEVREKGQPPHEIISEALQYYFIKYMKLQKEKYDKNA